VGEDVRTDVALLEVSLHDEAAFGVLVRRYVRAATMFAMQITGDRDDAEDIVQQAFITIYERSAAFDATRPFSPWLFGIVKRLALKRRARAAGRQRLLRLWGEQPDPALDARWVEGVLGAHVDDERLAARAREAMSSLSAMQRDCFDLVAVQAVATEDVAAMHGISESTVRQHVFRARRALRLVLGEHSADPAELKRTDS
jgi:RNA polymerase sigma-70 factor, ECF subfamily